MTSDPVKIINKKLFDVQKLIFKNYELQKKYPKQKRGLLIGLKTLRQLEDEMIDALKDAHLVKGKEVFENKLNGRIIVNGTMPIKDAGYLFIDEQNMFSAFGSEKALSMKANIGTKVLLDSQVNLAAVGAGSFRVILTNNQQILTDVDDAETTMKHAFRDLQKLVDCGADRGLLLEAESELGPKKINSYKKFLKTLYVRGINIEFSSRKSNRTDSRIFTIKKEEAKQIYDVLVQKEDKGKDEVILTGVIEAVDFVISRPKFKILNEQQKKPDTVYFGKHFEDDVVMHVKQLSKVSVVQITQNKGIGQEEFIEYHLIRFEDD